MKYEEILWLTVIATSYLKKVENIFLRYTQVYIYIINTVKAVTGPIRQKEKKED